jgi:hypothetical protein
MSNHYQKVRQYLQDLGYDIILEDLAEELCVINDTENGIMNAVIDCEYPILVIEQLLFELKEGADLEVYKELLRKNRDIVHGAFVLDETGTKLLFRDTLQLENLDLNELEGSLNSLKLLLAEYSGSLLDIAKK